MSDISRYRQYEPLFGSWYIQEKIGQGAIGQVYKIQRTELGTTYTAALKIITIPESPDDVKRVISSGVDRADLTDYYRNLINNIANEFKYLAKLKGNSYIVNYEDHQIIENEDELRWDVLIKTELLEPLVEHVVDHPLSEDDVLRLGIDLCRALKYCGQYNIIHRDIKPENIFLAPSGDYKLGDFGIARVVEETYVNLSRKGTYTYMAPEVFHGHRYDQSADLYSVGLVMYKYLNYGRVPFMPRYPKKLAFDDQERAFSERMSGKTIPEPIKGSARLRRAVLKACAYDPADRYESADEMLAELESLFISSNKRRYQAKHRKKKAAISTVKMPHDTVPAAKAEAAESAPASDINTAETVPAQSQASDIRSPEHRIDPAGKSVNSHQNSHKTTDKTTHSTRNILAATLIIAGLIAVGIYAAIPKQVTDITGIDDQVEMYYDGTLSPDYKIEPDWFKDEPISFNSSDDTVFTVTDTGEIEAVSVGEADLVMQAREYSETVHVSIVPKVTDIDGIEEEYSMYIGDTLQLKPTLKPESFSDEVIDYESSDPTVATVADDGTVSAAGEGETTLTLTSGGSSMTTMVNVTSRPVVRTYTNSGSSSGSKSNGSGNKSSSKSSGKSSSGSKKTKDSFGNEEYF